jgi:hypothetical protein
MTDLDPALIVKQFRDRLPPRAQHQLRNTGRIAALIHRAVFGHGWTLQQLLEEATRDLRGVANVGGLITFRLAWCADNDPPGPVHPPQLLPFCDRVQDVGPSAGMTCREMHGLVEDADGRPIRKCTCRTPPESDS